jgi:hypothetical protein
MTAGETAERIYFKMSHKPTQAESVKPEYSDAARQARREAQRAWRAKNKEKCAEYRRRYWERKGREQIEAGQGSAEA